MPPCSSKFEWGKKWPCRKWLNFESTLVQINWKIWKLYSFFRQASFKRHIHNKPTSTLNYSNQNLMVETAANEPSIFRSKTWPPKPPAAWSDKSRSKSWTFQLRGWLEMDTSCIHPRKLTAGGPQNDGPWKRWRLLNMAIFGIYVKFLGCIHSPKLTVRTWQEGIETQKETRIWTNPSGSGAICLFQGGHITMQWNTVSISSTSWISTWSGHNWAWSKCIF